MNERCLFVLHKAVCVHRYKCSSLAVRTYDATAGGGGGGRRGGALRPLAPVFFLLRNTELSFSPIFSLYLLRLKAN